MHFRYFILGAAAVTMTSLSFTASADEWSGIYAGIIGSADSVRANFSLPGDSNDKLLDNSSRKTKFVGGALIGYNYQFDNKIVGVEGDGTSAAGTQSVTACAEPSGCFTSAHDSFTTFNNLHAGTSERLRMRFGVIAHDTLFYGAAGYSRMHARLSLVGNCFDATNPTVPTVYNFDRSKSILGYNLALGVEHSISTRLFVRGEYLYEDFGSNTWRGTPPEWNDRKISLRTDQLRLAVGLRF